jgi:hypothetical protein
MKIEFYGPRELVVMDCNGLILCFGEETRAREKTAPAPLSRRAKGWDR